MPRRRKAVCILAGFIVCAVFWVVCERSVFTSNVLTAFIYSCSLHESEEFLNSLVSDSMLVAIVFYIAITEHNRTCK